MGCASSKEDDLPIVSLCRQRRDLIRAASDRRYDLAAAHAAYFRALDRVGDALHRFVSEDLAAAPSPPSSPVLTLPPSDGKSKSKSDVGSGGGGGGGGDSRRLSPSTSSISLSPSSSGSSFSHSHLPPENDADEHPHLGTGSRPEPGGRQEGFPAYPPEFSSSFLNPSYYVDPITARYGYRQPGWPPDEGPFAAFVPSNYFPAPAAGGPSFAFPDAAFHYMKKSGSNPSTFYLNPDAGSNGYVNYYYDGGIPTPRGKSDNATDLGEDHREPPPLRVAEVSAWDFLNVFDNYEQYLMDFKGRLGSSGSLSSPNSNEIREKEGIPELEEETEPESFREGEKKMKGVGTSAAGKSMAAPLEEAVDGMTSKGMETNDSSKGIPLAYGGMHNGSKEMLMKNNNRVHFEVEGSVKTEESCSGSSLGSSLISEESRFNDGLALHVHGMKDIVEAVEEIKEQFKFAAGCGEEVAKLLEVGKLRYRSRSRLLRVIFFRILDSLALSALKSSSNSSNEVQHPDARVTKVNKDTQFDHVTASSDKLSATLEKLYLWEKKLYKQVKDEEKLRVIYELECRRLKALDDGGAESHKIDSTRASIRELLTKISIAIKSVDVISRRIHKLRDEELRPQISELIQGLLKMWKLMLACHQKQFQAIVGSKNHNLIARSRNGRNSIAEATMQLEAELLNWSTCFRNWINTQKAYIGALNEWLMKWLRQEQEETPDGVVLFSPGRMGAPTIFILSNDWHQTVDRISDVGVTTAMQIFSDNIHMLWETQDEEQKQKLKAEYLSRDFSRRLRSLQRENGHADVLSDEKAMPRLKGESFPDHMVIALESVRKRLNEEKVKHQEIVKHVQEVASNSLQVGLVPIFEALGSYTMETLNAYEGVRIPSDDVAGTH